VPAEIPALIEHQRAFGEWAAVIENFDRAGFSIPQGAPLAYTDTPTHP
jgi:hypothetical protein